MKQRAWIRYIGAYLAANVVAVGMLMLFTGAFPKTRTGWALLLIFGFPLWLLGEAIGEKLLSKRVSNAVDPSPKPVSGFRMLYALLIMLCSIAVITVTYHVYKDFWHRHFAFFY